MFGISFGNVVIILVLGAVILRPSDMPKFARVLARGLRWARRKAAAFSDYLDKVAGEDEGGAGGKESFHQQVERMRREMGLDEPLLDDSFERKTPTLPTREGREGKKK
ncbi:MAG: hypothetical protein FWD15_04880 [Alphaproteobacteria bacterium]|nr:hypothetical protein [Alphaproteobacteria bacterium]